MEMRMLKFRILPRPSNWFGLIAVGALAMIGLQCKNDFGFTAPLTSEICNDGIDNDSNGFTDCRDPACAAQCTPQLAITPVASPITADSLLLTGTCPHAASISISLSPLNFGQGGQATVSGSAWSIMLRTLQNGNLTATAVAVDSTGLLRDTAAVNFDVLHP